MKGIIKTGMILLCCLSCKTNKTNEYSETVNMEGKELSKVLISEFTTGMEVVKLETGNDYILGGLTHIKLSPEYIYIKDQFFNGIYQFDRHGKYIKRLDKMGQGNGEYLEIADFIIDEQNLTLEIWDTRNNKLMIYNLFDFSFIKSIPISLNVAMGFVKKGNMYYFHTKGLRNQVNNQPTNSYVIAFDAETNTYTPLFDMLLSDDIYRVWEFGNLFTINTKKDIYLSMMWQNWIYKIEDKTVSEVLFVKAGSQDTPESIKNGTYEEKEDYLNSSASDNKYVGFRLLMFEGDNFIIGCTKGGFASQQNFYYMRLNNKDYLTDAALNDFVPSSPKLNGFFMEGNCIIQLITSASSPDLLKQYSEYFTLSEDDNPVLLLFKIK